MSDHKIDIIQVYISIVCLCDIGIQTGTRISFFYLQYKSCCARILKVYIVMSPSQLSGFCSAGPILSLHVYVLSM